MFSVWFGRARRRGIAEGRKEAFSEVLAMVSDYRLDVVKRAEVENEKIQGNPTEGRSLEEMAESAATLGKLKAITMEHENLCGWQTWLIQRS